MYLAPALKSIGIRIARVNIWLFCIKYYKLLKNTAFRNGSLSFVTTNYQEAEKKAFQKKKKTASPKHTQCQQYASTYQLGMCLNQQALFNCQTLPC